MQLTTGPVVAAVLAFLGFTFFGGLAALLIGRARDGRLNQRVLLALTGACGLSLIVILVSDWPWGALAGFWTRHAVLSAVLSTLLLLGAGYFAFEARENVREQVLDESLSTVAFGGLVSHAVDVDLALALLLSEAEPRAMWLSRKRGRERPLRWLREFRHEYDAACDPRLGALPPFVAIHDGGWRLALVDQAVRRVMGGMRDWAALLGQTRDGRSVLIRLGALRNRLLRLGRLLADPEAGDEALELLLKLRCECGVLALGLELASGTDHLRPEVLVEMPPGLQAAPAWDVLKELKGLAKELSESESPEQRRRLLADVRRRLGEHQEISSAGGVRTVRTRSRSGSSRD